MSLDDLPDDITALEDLDTYLHENMFPSRCKTDQMAECAPNDILDKFLMRTGDEQNSLPHALDYYGDSPRGSMGVEGYNPGGGGHQQPLPSHWESISCVRNVDFQELEDAAQDLMNADMQQSHYQQDLRMCNMSTPNGGLHSTQANSYMTSVKQEPEPYDQNMCSPYMKSSSEASFPIGSDKSLGSEEGGDRKERRREQNRRAARKCREKKKRHQDSLFKNYEVLRGENNKLKDEVDRLNRDLAELADVLRSHRASCPYAHTLPKLPANQSSGGATRRQRNADLHGHIER